MPLPIKLQLPEDYFREEIRNDYLISCEMKKIWAVELDLLVEFDRVARKLGLPYFLDSGSLLGAVRDAKLIPWDNDIDVIMFRNDYEKMIASYTEFKDPYFLQSYLTEQEYNRPHAQLRNSKTTGYFPYEGKNVRINQGIFLDVFVLDGLVDNENKLRKQIRELNKIRFAMECMFGPYSTNPVKHMGKKLIGDIYKMRYKNYQNTYTLFDKKMKKYTDTEFVDKIGYRHSADRMHPLRRDWFSSAIEADFEGFKVPIPVGYDYILREYFGDDYMVPRKAPDDHGSIIFDPEKPYTEYLK